MSTLLVVDDHHASRLALECTLAPLGHGILAAASAQEACRLIELVQVDVLITDLRMAGMSGTELAEVIRARNKRSNIPIVLLSGADIDDPQVKRATALDAVTFVQKPCDTSTLRKLIARLLRVTPVPRYATSA